MWLWLVRGTREQRNLNFLFSPFRAVVVVYTVNVTMATLELSHNLSTFLCFCCDFLLMCVLQSKKERRFW